MTNLTVPLASDGAITTHAQIDAGKATEIGNRVDGRRSLVIYNPAETPAGATVATWLWVGFDGNVTDGNGFPVPPGGTFQIATRRPVWGFATADLTVYAFAELDRIDPCDLPGAR